MFKNISTQMLDANSTEIEKLSSNIGTIIGSCGDTDLEARSNIIKNFPLAVWLMNTSLTKRTRQMAFDGTNNLCNFTEEDGKINIKIPVEDYWSKLPVSTENECCWSPIDFEKCSRFAPINLLCLKDCESILKSLISNQLKVNKPSEIDGSTLKAKKDEVAKMSMAFFTAYTAISGLDDTWTSVLKPFHGLLSIIENPAVFPQAGTNILPAIASVGCRMRAIAPNTKFVAWSNPITMQSLKDAVVPGQYGQLPQGWEIKGGEYIYNGQITFKEDRFIPVDLTTNTGEMWIMSEDAVGLLLGTTLYPTSKKFMRDLSNTESYDNGCAVDCKYYYNYGTALAGNYSKIAKIHDIPLTGACINAITDLPQIVNPTTLIPNVG